MTRPQKVTNIRDAENKKLSTWLPSNGTGIGLWRGRRVYYVNGKRQSGLTIRNPMVDNIGGGIKNVAKGTLGLAIQGAKDIYGLTKGTSNALLGMASPWNLAAMGRTKRNIAQLGIKPPKEQSEEVRLRIAENQAKLMTEGFGTNIDNKKLINQDKQELKNLKSKTIDPVEVEKITKMENLANDNQDKVKTGFPADANNTPIEEPTIEKGRTKWVGANTTWVDRGGNVIAPKIDKKKDFKRRRNRFELTKEEQKKIIMTSLEQEMYW